jgi:hypothetical protein
MGLDIVELVMTIEETFGIEIPDRDAERLRTIGDLYWYDREHVPGDAVPIVGSRDALRTTKPWARLLDVIEKETGIDRARLTRRLASSMICDWTDGLASACRITSVEADERSKHRVSRQHLISSA